MWMTLVSPGVVQLLVAVGVPGVLDPLTHLITSSL